jgi:AbrB family looped-hinge helix DNA binding protein
MRRRKGERYIMKATGIVRRVDDLGRIVIPKEIRRTLKIREGDPLQTTLTPIDRFCMAIHSVVERYIDALMGRPF